RPSPPASPLSTSSFLLLPLRSPLFPYTTLFRSTLLHAPTPPHGTGHPPGGHHRHAQQPPTVPPSPRRAATINRMNTNDSGCWARSEEHTSELQSRFDLVCRLLLEKKKHTKPGQD